MILVNATPHPLSIQLVDGTYLDLPKGEGPYIPRLLTERTHVETILVPAGYVRVMKTVFGQVFDLPPPEAGTLFIVSALVAENCPQRGDLRAPGELVRNATGQVIGCMGLTTPKHN